MDDLLGLLNFVMDDVMHSKPRQERDVRNANDIMEEIQVRWMNLNAGAISAVEALMRNGGGD